MDMKDFMAMDFIKPCQVTSYNHETRTVVVKTQAKRLNNGSELESTDIHDIPVCFPSWDQGKGFMVHPIKAGDVGLLLVCGRSTEEFMEGSLGAPEDPRIHDVNDGFFLPATFVHNPVPTDGECIHLQYNDVIWRMFNDRIEIDANIIHRGNYTQTGDFTQEGNRIQTGNETITGNTNQTGNVTVAGEVSANGIPLSTHLHQDTKQEKGSVSGKPIP